MLISLVIDFLNLFQLVLIHIENALRVNIFYFLNMFLLFFKLIYHFIFLFLHLFFNFS